MQTQRSFWLQNLVITSKSIEDIEKDLISKDTKAEKNKTRSPIVTIMGR